MASVNATTLKLRFPEFASEADATVEFAIEDAARGFDSTAWGTDMNLALSYLSAHLLQVAIERRGSGQVLASERIGEISMTYREPRQLADASDLTTTAYGSRYLDLARFNFPAIAII